MTGPRLVSVEVSGDAAPWERLGFHVEADHVRLGTIDIALGGAGTGLTAWTFEGPGSGDLDGLPTHWDGTPTGPAPGAHPNGAVQLDHVVVMTPDLARTTAALATAGLDLRRTRDAGTPERPATQAFYRLGEVILEVVGDVPPDGPARFWGLVAVVPDVDALAAQLGESLVGGAKDAVQPGRRIVTVRRAAGLPLPFAFLTPHVKRT